MHLNKFSFPINNTITSKSCKHTPCHISSERGRSGEVEKKVEDKGSDLVSPSSAIWRTCRFTPMLRGGLLYSKKLQTELFYKIKE